MTAEVAVRITRRVVDGGFDWEVAARREAWRLTGWSATQAEALSEAFAEAQRRIRMELKEIDELVERARAAAAKSEGQP